jgi:ABC-type multidrug transport system ATPase subunit
MNPSYDDKERSRIMQLEINHLVKRYGTKTALDGVSISLSPGVYGLLGPNGAGKSTLMNVLVGNLTADEGTVSFDGEDVRKMGRDFRSILGFMPQQPGLYDRFTGFRFLSYMAALKGMDRRRAREDIEKAAALVNLSDALGKKLGAYSGGMKQRIMIAQAILNDPKILILDEPTAGLDPKERIRVRNMIAEIAFDKIVLLATHVAPDVEYIGKEVILLKQGQVIKQDTPRNILQDLRGKVFELRVDRQQVPELERKFLVSNITEDFEKTAVRIVSDSPPEGYEYTDAAPTLEEEYLYVFADEVK